MEKKEQINIVVSSDENYVPHLMTLIGSIGTNNERVDSIVIHIFDGGIKEQTRKKIEELKDRFLNISFLFYTMTEDVLKEKLGEVLADRSLSAYARIFIPELLDEDKAIYFDVDAIVLGDLRELYKIDVSKFAIAGVRDTNPIQRHRNVGLQDSDVYINSGMILWNVKKCREIQFTKQCLEFITSRNGNVDAMDQGTINGVLSKMGMIRILPPQYNVMTSLFQFTREDIIKMYQLSDYYADSQITYAKKQPLFVHFTPNFTTRPWERHCKHPLRNLYWQYRIDTMGEEKKLSDDKRSIKHRILGWIGRTFSIDLYCFLTGIKNDVTREV